MSKPPLASVLWLLVDFEFGASDTKKEFVRIRNELCLSTSIIVLAMWNPDKNLDQLVMQSQYPARDDGILWST